MLLGLVLVPRLLFGADNKIAYIAEQVRGHADFRVRTAAALKLGVSDDVAAVKPLCTCLKDQTEVESVRVACAAALGKLKKPGSEACLKDRKGDDSKKVAEQVVTSLKALGGPTANGSAAKTSYTCPSASETTTTKPKYLVAIRVSNHTTRPDSEVRSIVEREGYCKLSSMPRFRVVVGDDTESEKFDALAQDAKVDGYYVTVSVDLKYDAGSLKVVMKALITTHRRDLKGELEKKMTMPGVSSPSVADENDLLKVTAEKLFRDFADLRP